MNFALFRTYAALFLAVFLDILSFGLMYPLIVGLFHSSFVPAAYGDDGRDSLMAIAFALFPLASFFGNSLLGDLSDALGRRRTLMICMAGLGAGYAVMWLAVELGQIWLFLVGRVVCGLMAGTSPIAQATMVDATSEADRGDAMAQLTLVNTVSLVAGPAIGGVLGHIDFRLPLAVALVLCAATLYALWRSPFAGDGERRAFVFDWKQPFRPFARIAEREQVIPATLAFFLFQLGFLIYYTLILIVMQRHYGLSTAQVGLFSMVMGLGFAFASAFLYGRVKHRFVSDRRVALLGLVPCGALLVLSALPLPVPAQVALAFLASLANIFAFVALLSAIPALVDESERGWAMGIANASQAVCMFLSGLLAGLLALLPSAVLLVTSGLVVLAGILPARRIPDPAEDEGMSVPPVIASAPEGPEHAPIGSHCDPMG